MKRINIKKAAIAAMLIMGITLAAAAFTGFASSLNDETRQIPGLCEFETEDNGEGVTIVAYNGAGTEVEIPAEIGGKTVTQIASHAFYGTRARLVHVPECVRNFDEGAFENDGAKIAIYCKRSSAAERFASDNGVVFIQSFSL